MKIFINRFNRLRRERNAYRKALDLLIKKWGKADLTYQDWMDALEVLVKHNK